MDFIRFSDLSHSSLERLWLLAAELRAGRERGEPSHWCAGRRVAFIWDGEGFRNRAAFELGVAEEAASASRSQARAASARRSATSPPRP